MKDLSKRDSSELAPIAPHAMDIVRTRDSGVAMVRAGVHAALKEEPTAPAERVARLSMECSALAEKLLGKKNVVRCVILGIGDVEVQRLGETMLITISRERSSEMYLINELGQVMSAFTDSPSQADAGEGRFGRAAEGARLNAVLKQAIAQLGA